MKIIIEYDISLRNDEIRLELVKFHFWNEICLWINEISFLNVKIAFECEIRLWNDENHLQMQNSSSIDEFHSDSLTKFLTNHYYEFRNKLFNKNHYDSLKFV